MRVKDLYNIWDRVPRNNKQLLKAVDFCLKILYPRRLGGPRQAPKQWMKFKDSMNYNKIRAHKIIIKENVMRIILKSF